jgi:hypothetical protein
MLFLDKNLHFFPMVHLFLCKSIAMHREMDKTIHRN